MDLVSEILERSAQDAEKYKPITVKKHLDLEYDLGTLLALDTNDLDTHMLKTDPNDYLLNLTRDNAQLLLNQIWELPTEKSEDVILVKLPPQKTVSPRLKPVPKPRPLTKWEQFAKEKGIQKKKKAKLSWDEQLKKWVPLYGFKRAKVDKEKNWLLEVPQNANPLEDQFAKKIEAKSERVAKNELQRLRNIAKARKVKVPRMGMLNPDVSSSKELQAAVTIAKASTASVGKFQNKLPKEKVATGVAALVPGSSRKRKFVPSGGKEETQENLRIMDSILAKRPKLNTERAAERLVKEHVEPPSNKRNNSKNKGNSSNTSKKPKGGAGKRKVKGGGRKRR